LAEGGVEYRDASGGVFEEAIKSGDQPLDPAAQARKREFGQFADQFIEQLRRTELTGATDVSVVYRYRDQHGLPFDSEPVSITPHTSVHFPGEVDQAREVANAMHLDSLISTINSLVRNAPTGALSVPERPGESLEIIAFELLIEQP
jgi:hypothetical protein